MSIISMIFVGIITLEHLFIAWVEMFAWTTRGAKMFPHLSADFLKTTKEMAANQGLYNLFLAAGLIWSLTIQAAPWNLYIAAFFLGCVVVAGIFGALTSNKSIFFKQAFPAILSLAVLCIAR